MAKEFQDLSPVIDITLDRVSDEDKRLAKLRVCEYAVRETNSQEVATELLDILGLLDGEDLKSSHRKPRTKKEHNANQ